MVIILDFYKNAEKMLEESANFLMLFWHQTQTWLAAFVRYRGRQGLE